MSHFADTFPADPLLALLLAAALAWISPVNAADARPDARQASAATGDSCSSDDDCVSISVVSPSCRRADPKAAQVCPGVDRRRADEYGRVDCAVNVPCRAAAAYRCIQRRCAARE